MSYTGILGRHLVLSAHPSTSRMPLSWRGRVLSSSLGNQPHREDPPPQGGAGRTPGRLQTNLGKGVDTFAPVML